VQAVGSTLKNTFGTILRENDLVIEFAAWQVTNTSMTTDL